MNKFIRLLACVWFVFTTTATASLHRIDSGCTCPELSADLYLDLVKKSLTNMIYEDAAYHGPYNAYARECGHDHPLMAHTMVGMKRLNNIQYCMEQILQNGIPGDCIETGVWRGGCTILMRAILRVYGDKSRKVWVADSFEGLPPPNLIKYPVDKTCDLSNDSFLKVSLDQVRANFDKYGLLDRQVIFLKGFFVDTLAQAPIESLALLRLDGDMYESTLESLESLYPKLSVGGYILIDDFGCLPTCAQAVNDYRNAHQITDPIIWVDTTGIYWQKTQVVFTN